MSAPGAVPEILRPIWERSLPLIRERLVHLDRTAAQTLSQTLSQQDLELARSNAHKLVGSLGMFGFPRGSEIAREIEILLETTSPLDAPLLQQLTTNLRSLLKLS